jgi:ABC-type branched-subunit amino acid transport system substrate-binding protein
MSRTPIIKRVFRFVSKRIYPIIVGLLLLPLVAAVIKLIVIDRVIADVRGPGSYKIYVVGNLQHEGSAAQQIYKEFMTGGDLKPIDGTPIDVRLLDDQGNPDQARQIATKIAAKDDALMVIGHIGSTQTRAALPAYFSATPPVPVILTTETNPNLAPPKLRSVKRFPIFRLSPNDTQQAKSAADFLERTRAKAIWVVEDVDNPVYSSYLGSEFVRQIQRSEDRKVLLMTDDMHVPGVSVFNALKIDWVFFAGGSDHALVLIRQIQKIYGRTKPGILLTDASADPALIEEGGNDVEGVYLTYPMNAHDYAKNAFRPYGAMARDVVDYLIASAATSDSNLGFSYELRHLLAIRRVRDARTLLDAQIEDAQITQARFITTNDLTNDVTLQFGVGGQDDDGTRVDRNAKFNVWQICGGKFGDISIEHTTTVFTPSCPPKDAAKTIPD